MVETHNPAGQSRGCARCGKMLPPDAPQGLCAACLLLASAETLTGSAGDATTMWGSDPPNGDDGPRLIAGQAWGSYRIGRLLGRGGMGEVYEAEQMKTGRRLALKVLRSRLQNAEERARFLREGQLAASVSHPHTVYIFGSEEISGTPVISMELAPGGTLKDRVVSQGPLPPREAVDAILDIIGGLDAAQSAGILHRDIKPSNCFLDGEGAVKVGDFGLSISTLARDVHRDVSSSGFQGTPQFASPEQLRGEPLDVRADIYAVGATLYYLLTGKPPFDARDLRELLSRVGTETPQSPRSVRPEIPSRLASVVMECLAKTPSQRPESYAALAGALRPFSAANDAPARLGIRFLAGLVDYLILVVTWAIPVSLRGNVSSVASTAEGALWSMIPVFGFFLCEGLWGATPGKKLFGLRVTSVDGGVASWGRIALRNVIYNVPSLVFFLPIPIMGIAAYDAFLISHPAITIATSLIAMALYIAVFVTARRHNGWAGVHDLISGTRLVIRTPLQQRPSYGTTEVATKPQADAAGKLQYGPFKVVSDVGAIEGTGDSETGRLLVAFDPALRRRVWIRTVAPGAPMIAAARRDASRPVRLHWLTGRRSPEENWDAFESPDGEPFLSNRTPVPWTTMKIWLQDLTNELQAAVREQSLPKLSLDRVWIRSDGRLVLLEFPAASAAMSEPSLTPVQLLSAVATQCLSQDMSAAGPVPLKARSTILGWSGPDAPALEQAHEDVREFSSVPDRVSKWRRAVPIALAFSPFLLIAFSMVIVLPGFTRNEEISRLFGLFTATNPAVQSRMANPVYRTAVERYLAGQYGSSFRDDTFWNNPATQSAGLKPFRELAAEITARHPSVSSEEVAQAAATIAVDLERIKSKWGPNAEFRIALAVVSMLLMVVVGLSLISAAILPGGVTMRMLGLAAVRRDGMEIGHIRSVIRAFMAWFPTIVFSWFVFVVIISSSRPDEAFTLSTMQWLGLGVTLILPVIGAIWTITHPTRGLHDRVMRTWVVPR
jgi:uncharacterized RDD family membrane protein YckC